MLCYTGGASYILRAAIHFLIKKIEIMLERRKRELLEKKPGAVLEDYPKVVWVRILKCLIDLATSHLTLGLRGKFNTALEDNLSKASAKHHLISIEVDVNDFDQWGKLTTSGMKTFWQEFDKGMKKFDHGEISLHPRKPAAKSQGSQSEANPRTTACKLLTPPRERIPNHQVRKDNTDRHHRQRSRSSSHNCKHGHAHHHSTPSSHSYHRNHSDGCRKSEHCYRSRSPHHRSNDRCRSHH